MQERTASEQDGCRKERMQDRLDTGRMQYRAAVGQVRGRIGRMKDRKDAEQDGCRTDQMQDQQGEIILKLRLGQMYQKSFFKLL